MLSSAGLKFNNRTLGSSRAGKGIWELGNSGNSALELDLGRIEWDLGRNNSRNLRNIPNWPWKFFRDPQLFWEFHPIPKIPFKSDFSHGKHSLCPVPPSPGISLFQENIPSNPRGVFMEKSLGMDLEQGFWDKIPAGFGKLGKFPEEFLELWWSPNPFLGIFPWSAEAQKDFSMDFIWCDEAWINFYGFFPDVLKPKKIFHGFFLEWWSPNPFFRDFFPGLVKPKKIFLWIFPGVTKPSKTFLDFSNF